MASLVVYYSDRCPHSLSLLEVVTKFQTQYSKDNIELANVRTTPLSALPPEVVVVPTIFDRDGDYWAGDHAFARLSNLEVQSQGRASHGQLQQKGVSASDGGIELIRDHSASSSVNAGASLDPQAPQQAASAALESEQRKNAMQSSLFETDVIMPRKS